MFLKLNSGRVEVSSPKRKAVIAPTSIIGTNKLAIVHLTWKGKKEASNLYPKTEIYNDWIDCFEKRILRDNEEHTL